MDEQAAKPFFASINVNGSGADGIFPAVAMIDTAHSHTLLEQKMRIATDHSWFRIG
jgi:hypothetical protein